MPRTCTHLGTKNHHFVTAGLVQSSCAPGTSCILPQTPDGGSPIAMKDWGSSLLPSRTHHSSLIRSRTPIPPHPSLLTQKKKKKTHFTPTSPFAPTNTSPVRSPGQPSSDVRKLAPEAGCSPGCPKSPVGDDLATRSLKMETTWCFGCVNHLKTGEGIAVF